MRRRYWRDEDGRGVDGLSLTQRHWIDEGWNDGVVRSRACAVVEGAPGFHHKFEKGVGIVFVRVGCELWTGRGNGQYAQEVGVADRAVGEMDDDPEVGGEITMKGAVALEAKDDGREGLLRCRHGASLEEEVAQFRDLTGIAVRHLLELQWLQHA